MEGVRVVKLVMQALRERGLETELDHLNVLSERSSVGAAVQLLEALQSGSLTQAEQRRFDDLQAAGVDAPDDFQCEELIIAQLERSIEFLEGSSAEPTDEPIGKLIDNATIGKLIDNATIGKLIDSEPVCSAPLEQVWCDLPVLSEDLLASLDTVKDLVSAISRDCQAVLDQVSDKSNSTLPGYQFELLKDWQVFTLCTVDNIEDAWTAAMARSVPSDKDYIDRQRDRFLCALLADVKCSLATAANVLCFVHSALTWVDSGMQSNMAALADLLQSFGCALQRTKGVTFSKGPVVAKRNQDIVPAEREAGVPCLDGLPQYRLKSLIKQSQECAEQVARLSRGLGDLQSEN